MSSRKRYRKSRRRSWIRFKLGLVGLLSILLICYAVYSSLNTSNTDVTQPSELKAAIVDHLSLTQPNQTFVETAISMLEKAGFAVDYYKGEEVNVEFYRNLPTFGYKLMIMRVHSTATMVEGAEAPVVLFTSERVSSTKYIYEQLTGQLVSASFSQEESERGIQYFGIQPLFVTQSMKGRFQNTVIIMMGCEGLDNPLMAEAFVEKGAKVYISWNQPVLASHTDTATTHLLQHFLIEKRTVKDSLRETLEDVGADPAYQSLLGYYPFEAGDYTVQSIVGNLTAKITAEVKTQNVFTR